MAKRKNWPAEARRVVELFLTGRAAGTATAYRQDLRRFARFLAKRGPAAVRSAVRELIRAGHGNATELAERFKGEMRRVSSTATVNRRLSTLRSLTATAQAIGAIDWTLAIKPMRATAYRDTRGPGRPAVQRMLKAAKRPGGAKAARDMALIGLLYGMALRREEVVELNVENVDLDRPAVSIVGKGRTEREWLDVPLEVQEAIATWLTFNGGDGDDPLFVTWSRAADPQARLTGNGLYALIRALGAAVGVKATPHGLRHTAITDAILMGKTLPDVAKFSRHRNLRTLQTYYDQLAGTALEISTALVAGLDWN